MQKLLTVVLIAERSRHLLERTLDSLANQEEKNFEVILLDSLGNSREFLNEKRFPIESHQVGRESLASMMNRGLLLAKGDYVQFLFPGDRFITSQATQSIQRLAEENRFPELIYCSYLQRDPRFPPRAATHLLDLELLQKGVAPTIPRAYWFLTSKIRAIGGFDARCHYRPSFDLLCRLIKDHKARFVHIRRVLTDSEWRRKSPVEVMHYVIDSCSILKRRFGIWYALRYLFVQDHRQVARWVWKFVKDAFWRSPESV